MSILRHGIDLVSVARIARMLADHGERFMERCFTSDERAYCTGPRAAEHLAARFAAKEAVLKAIGTGWSGGIAWTDIEITRSGTGRPGVALFGEARRHAAAQGLHEWELSLSHAGGFAMASVIARG